MINTQSHRAQLDQLETIEARLKRGNDMFQLRKSLVMLNELMRVLPREPSPVRAKYFFLRGVLYTKGALSPHQSDQGWIASSVESLLYAGDQFGFADETLKRLDTPESPLTVELQALQRSCAYEAKVAESALLVWGQTPRTVHDSNCLTPKQQEVVARHMRHRHMLRSHF